MDQKKLKIKPLSPEDAERKFIGQYEILNIVGFGGMGVVYLAFDKSMKRTLAIKKIRSHLVNEPIIQNRFLKEAHLAASLTHPSIIPIYSIEKEEKSYYYTMPYIEGNTLRNLLNRKKTALSFLLRIFHSICQAVAFIHSHNILHRDLKPTNILIGNYGQVFIIDWGVAQTFPYEETVSNAEYEDASLTQPGKILGTLSHMAPERIMGEKANFLTDIYALGVILYEILTYQSPFERTSFKNSKQGLAYEKIIDPSESSANDIPEQLSSMTKTCLQANPLKRYQSVSTLVNDLEEYLEGEPKWHFLRTLSTNSESDWSFQEHIYLSSFNAHLSKKFNDWAFVRHCKHPLSGNYKITFSLSITRNSHGIGIAVALPKQKKFSLTEGYCIWIDPSAEQAITLYKNHIPVGYHSLPLDSYKEYEFTIKKEGTSITIYISDEKIIQYDSPHPLMGNDLAVVSHDIRTHLSKLNIYIRSLYAHTECISLPDSLYQMEQFEKAIEEYNNIAISFKGRKESLHALFRSGVCLIEQAKKENSPKKSYEKAFQQFDQLCHTPLEQLGKSYLYALENNHSEEKITIEYGLCKYANHDHISHLNEYVLSRFHATFLNDHDLNHQFLVLALHYNPACQEIPYMSTLITQSLDRLPKTIFTEHSLDISNHEERLLALLYHKKEDHKLSLKCEDPKGSLLYKKVINSI